METSELMNCNGQIQLYLVMNRFKRQTNKLEVQYSNTMLVGFFFVLSLYMFIKKKLN